MLVEVFAAVFIFLSLELCSIIPYCILVSSESHRRHGSSFFLSLCNCVACGIFLSTCFLGLIPHVRHQEGLLQKSMTGIQSNESAHMNLGKRHSFLNTEVIVLAGILLILLIEQAIFLCSSAKHSHSHGVSARGEHRLLPTDIDAAVPLVDHPFDVEAETEDIVFRKEYAASEHEPSAGHHGHSHMIALNNGLTISSLLLLLGLSIHSIFEGIALGLQRDRGDFVRILVAIMMHEVLCCFAFGVSLAQQRAPRSAAIISSLVLSACIPCGMFAAFMVEAFDDAHSLLLRFLLEGLAAGTFIYVAAVEMLPNELGNSHDRKGLLKAVFVTLGAVAFFGLQQVIGHGHGD